MSEALEMVLEYCKINHLSPLYAKVKNLLNVATVKLLNKVGFIEHIMQTDHKGAYWIIFKWTE
jgi:hypothetical protein